MFQSSKANECSGCDISESDSIFVKATPKPFEIAVQQMYMRIHWAVISILLGATIVGCKRNTNPQIDFIVSPLKKGDPDIKLSTDYKDKPVVVYNWATWCAPCKQFAPILNTIADEYKKKGIEFLAISNEDPKKVSAAELKEPHRMTVLVDPFGSAGEALNVQGLPTITVLDRDHRPIWGTIGIQKATEGDLKKALDTLI